MAIKGETSLMRSVIEPANAGQLAELIKLRYGWVNEVRWTPDGRILAVGSGNAVQLYIDGIGPKADLVLREHDAPVKSLDFAPGGRYLATVGADLVAYVWDISQPAQPVLHLTGYKDALNAVAFSPDGRWLAAAGVEHAIYVWDMADGGALHGAFAAHTGEINSLVFLDNTVLLSASRDRKILMWNIPDGNTERVVGQHEDWVRRLMLNPTRTLLASVSKDGSARLWDVRQPHSPQMKAVIEAHEGGADSIDFSPDNRLLVTGGRDHQIRIWDLEMALTKERLTINDASATLSAHVKPVMTLAFNPIGTMLISGGGDNTVRVWSVQDGTA